MEDERHPDEIPLFPSDMIYEIAQHADVRTYQTLLTASPDLYRSLTPMMKIDLAIRSGCDIHIRRMSKFMSGIRWTRNNIMHNPYGPALEFSNGNMEYRVNGKYCRPDGGPTRIINGTQYWINANDQLHNLNGPAVVNLDGTVSWYINGIQYSSEDSFTAARDGIRN